MNEPQTAEQPSGESSGAGIYTMDDAIKAVADMPYDSEEDSVLPEVVDEAEEPIPDMEAIEEFEEGAEESEDQESDEDQPEEVDQPEATSEEVVDLPSDDTVIAKDGDVSVTLGELRESYRESKSAQDNMQADYQRKTQALAEQVSEVEKHEETALAHYQLVTTALGQGLQQLDQSVDWNALKSSDPGEFQAKLEQRNQMEAQLKHFNEGAENLLADAQDRKAKMEKRQAKEALDYLKGSIEGWNQDLYEKVARFAESQGMPAGDFYEIRSGVTLKTFHDLMRSQEAKEAALSKIQKKPPSEVAQKAQKRDQMTKEQKKMRSLEERAKKGDKEAAVELLMRTPYDN